MGQQTSNPDPQQVALAEELLVRLEHDDIAVRLNLLGQPGEHPDFIVAAWVLPYVYALRGDRDWRRIPQLTGSRQVSPLAVQTYKLLEARESNIPQLKHALGREVSESAVTRAITELWQQLRIIPLVAAPGETPNWQLLRVRFQKAIAEGASTSQVTAISVLASIYLQAVIAASMEDVELFLAPLTARSKVREVLRGLVATRQVHTISLGHAPHFYVAGTLPEFAQPPTAYASAFMPASSYFQDLFEHESGMESKSPAVSTVTATPAVSIAASAEPEPAAVAAVEPAPASVVEPEPEPEPVPEPVEHPAPAARQEERSHFNRPAGHKPERKPAQSSNGRTARDPSVGEARGPRHVKLAAKRASTAASHRTHASNGSASVHPKRSQESSNGHKASAAAGRTARPAAKAAGKSAEPAHSKRPRAAAAGPKSASGKRFGISAQKAKKR